MICRAVRKASVLGGLASREQLRLRVRSLQLAVTKFRGFREERSYRLRMARTELAMLRDPLVVQ